MSAPAPSAAETTAPVDPVEGTEPKKVIKLSEIGLHNTRNDLWIAINGKVYDATKFVDEHPGGEEVIIDVAGKDATKEFEDVGHSEYAVEILDNMLVGDGDVDELIVREKPLGVAEFGDDTNSGSGLSKILLLLAIAAVVGAYFHFKKSD